MQLLDDSKNVGIKIGIYFIKEQSAQEFNQCCVIFHIFINRCCAGKFKAK